MIKKHTFNYIEATLIFFKYDLQSEIKYDIIEKIDSKRGVT